MRLQDGDTQVLTGLAPLKTGGPGPSARDTELVLLVTTRVTRVPDIRSSDRLPLWVGSELDQYFP